MTNCNAAGEVTGSSTSTLQGGGLRVQQGCVHHWHGANEQGTVVNMAHPNPGQPQPA